MILNIKAGFFLTLFGIFSYKTIDAYLEKYAITPEGILYISILIFVIYLLAARKL